MRRCVIVGNPGLPGQDNYCEGVNVDLRSYREFLFSAPRRLLVRVGDHCAQAAVALRLTRRSRRIGASDHLLFIFSGHGWYSSQSNSTILHLTEREQVDSDDIKAYGKSKLIILDCCRKVYREYISESMFAESLRKAMGPQLHPDECRRFYDKSVEKCEKCLISLHSCSIGETSGDSSEKGGVFSFNILQSALEVYRQSTIDTSRNYLLITAPTAFEAAAARVRRQSGNAQNPTIEKPRSGEYFPVAVIA